MEKYFYDPYADMSVAMISFLMIILLSFSYVKRNFQFKLLFIAIINLYIASTTSILYNYIISDFGVYTKFKFAIVHLIHNIRNVTCISLWFLFILYLYVTVLDYFDKKKVFDKICVCAVVLFSYIIIESISTITKFGLYEKNGLPYEHFVFNPFIAYYIALALFCFIFFLLKREIFPKKVHSTVLILFIYCFLIMIIERFFWTRTFKTLSFLIPVISLYMFFHGNSYNIETGALGPDVFSNFVSELLNKKQNFIIITLKMDRRKKHDLKSENITRKISRICDKEFKGGMLFQKNSDLLNIIIKNPNKKSVFQSIDNLYKFANKNFTEHNLQTKIIVLDYTADMNIFSINKFLEFNKYLINNSEFNKISKYSKMDYEEFVKYNYIKNQLIDITNQNNLDDERVLVYCQPIVRKDKACKNAEVLMRLKLDNIGLVFPNDFIPIAEEYNLIHTLSLIILNKSCKMVNEMLKEGFDIDRVSINFSANEFDMESFYHDTINIINKNNTPYNKFAFEITETKFNKVENLNSIMKKLKEKGIVFYLDDFGTGYSNIDRIIELPFSTIKFDRSFVSSSLKNENTKFIISNLCNIFNHMDLNLLFEGIEDDVSENMCLEMGANYLQGYKYSKPIPFENIRNFLNINKGN